MRVWVRSEYAPELAVVFAWFGALIPWNVTFSELQGVGSVLFVRFPLFQIRYAYRVPAAEAISIRGPYSAIQFQRAGEQVGTIADAYTVWLLGAVLVAAALALSVALYLAEERVTERLRAPVTLMGALLVLAGMVHAVTTVLLYTRGFPGLPVPVGVPFELGFGALLLSAERV
jgi:hypothetical protein